MIRWAVTGRRPNDPLTPSLILKHALPDNSNEKSLLLVGGGEEGGPEADEARALAKAAEFEQDKLCPSCLGSATSAPFASLKGKLLKLRPCGPSEWKNPHDLKSESCAARSTTIFIHVPHMVQLLNG